MATRRRAPILPVGRPVGRWWPSRATSAGQTSAGTATSSCADPMTATATEHSRAEAEQQLSAAADRHREVLASMQQLGRPEAGQHAAVKAVVRAVALVSFALKCAAEVGVPFERLAKLTGWEPDLVREGLGGAET
jgi:hypothetical protein